MVPGHLCHPLPQQEGPLWKKDQRETTERLLPWLQRWAVVIIEGALHVYITVHVLCTVHYALCTSKFTIRYIRDRGGLCWWVSCHQSAILTLIIISCGATIFYSLDFQSVVPDSWFLDIADTKLVCSSLLQVRTLSKMECDSSVISLSDSTRTRHAKQSTLTSHVQQTRRTFSLCLKQLRTLSLLSIWEKLVYFSVVSLPSALYVMSAIIYGLYSS